MQRNTRRSEQLWARVHGALDAHRDPLEDARTVELLAQCPDEAQRVLRLLDLLQPAPIVRRSWPAPLLAAGLFLALALGAWRAAPLTMRSMEVRHATQALALRSRPIDFRVQLEEITATGTRRLVHSPAALSHSFEPSTEIPNNGLLIAEGDRLQFEHIVPQPQVR